MSLDEILVLARTNPIEAAEQLMRGLMRGDPATLKQGYSLGSAFAATWEQLPLSPGQMGAALERIIGPDPVVLVTVEGGIAEIDTIEGREVDVIHLDWDIVFDEIESNEDELDAAKANLARLRKINETNPNDTPYTNVVERSINKLALKIQEVDDTHGPS